VLLEHDAGNIRIQQDVYVKLLERSTGAKAHKQLTTYATAGARVFKKHVAKPEDKQPQAMGLEDSEKCMLRLLRKNEDISKKNTNNINISFHSISAPLLGYPESKQQTSMRAINREILEKQREKDFMGENKQAIEAVAKKNKELEEQQRELTQKGQIKEIMAEAFETPVGNIAKLVDVPDGTILHTYGVKEIQTRYGKQFLLLCSPEAKRTETTKLTLFWAVYTLNQYIETGKQFWSKLDTNCYGTYSDTSIFMFRKVGFRYTSTKHKYAYVEIIAGRKNTKELTKADCIQEIPTSTKGLPKIDKLIKDGVVKEGDTLKIVGKRELVSILVLEAKLTAATQEPSLDKNKQPTRTTIYFSANSWLKAILNEHFDKFKGADGIPVLNCIVGPEKRSSNRINEHTFVVGMESTGCPEPLQPEETKPLPVEEAPK
jgi:hypothetical protein